VFQLRFALADVPKWSAALSDDGRMLGSLKRWGPLSGNEGI
jgi:hypothetical protein